MRAYSSNATFFSNIYTQEAIDTNWNEYQIVVTSPSNNVAIRAADSNTTNLSVLDESRIYAGNTIYLTTDGANVVSGIAGVITTGTIKTQNSTPVAVASKSNTNSIFQTIGVPSGVSYPYGNRGFYLRPDGKYFYIVNNDGVAPAIVEFQLATPGNFNTATATGKTFTAPGQNGIGGVCFSNDGRYLYTAGSASQVLMRFTLRTPWDLSTVNATLDVQTYGLNSYMSFPDKCTNIRISADGTKIVLISSYSTNAGKVYAYNFGTPWDVTSLVSVPYINGIAPTGSIGPVDVSLDGSTWVWLSSMPGNAVYQHNISVAVAATPWNSTTLGSPIVLNLANSTYQIYFSTSYPMSPCIHRDGSLTLLPSIYATSGSTYSKLHAHYDVDILLSKNINISSFGLSATPTQVWISQPTTNVALTSTSNSMYSYARELELDVSIGGYTGSNATTAAATVGIDGSGVLQIGDTISLNNTTTVTLTGVTETANGLIRQDPGTATDYIKWSGKTFATGLTNPKVRFSDDGSRMYVAGTGALATPTLYMYTLSTPWDITTATWNNKDYIRLSTLNGGYTHKDFDIKPDGSSIVVLSASSEASSNVVVRTDYYTMSRKHDINSLTFVRQTNAYGGYGTTNYVGPGRWNKNGTQFSFCIYSTSNDTYYQGYWSCTTPYDMNTAGAFQTFSTGGGGAGVYYSGWDSVWTPDGLNLLTGGISNGTNPGSDAWVFTRTANTAYQLTSGMFGTRTSALSTIAIDWPAASGVTTSSTANSMDISTDGTKLYLALTNGTIYQFNVRTKSLTKYALTFATQANPPGSIFIPDRSSTVSMTATANANNLILTSNTVSANGRALQFKFTNTPLNSEITQTRINLKKSQ
jgi:hypothetical protein